MSRRILLAALVAASAAALDDNREIDAVSEAFTHWDDVQDTY